MSFLLYKILTIHNNVCGDFRKISDHFPKISEDFSKLVRRPDERFRIFTEDFQTFSEDYRKFRKITEDDRRRSEEVPSYINKSVVKVSEVHFQNMISSHVRISYRLYQFVTNRYTTNFYIINIVFLSSLRITLPTLTFVNYPSL